MATASLDNITRPSVRRQMRNASIWRFLFWTALIGLAILVTIEIFTPKDSVVTPRDIFTGNKLTMGEFLSLHDTGMGPKAHTPKASKVFKAVLIVEGSIPSQWEERMDKNKEGLWISHSGGGKQLVYLFTDRPEHFLK